ncbi:hypothetical protein [Streptomyces sp. NPDC059597]|uniref:hypothetical protein n=1 Tax=Streptomyces sp. NPDC059597 TaxID=3346879 RepID=UPI0036B45A2D
MRHVRADGVICVLDWNPATPAQLTTLAVTGEQADTAERVAASASAGTAGTVGTVGRASWPALPVSVRRRLVRTWRSVPTLGLYCIIDEAPPGAPPSGFLRAAVADTAEQFAPLRHARTAGGLLLTEPSEEVCEALSTAPSWEAGTRSPFPPQTSFPGLRELVRLTALFCRENQYRTDIPDDEDLLGIYDTYTVGGL